MAYEVSVKSKIRLKGAQKIAKFYENVGRDLDPQNMTWLFIKRFLEQWKALMERKKEDFGLPPQAYQKPSCPQVDGIDGTVPWTEGGSS